MGDRTQKNQFDIVGRVLFVGKPVQLGTNFLKAFLVLEVYVNNRYRKEVPFDYINENALLIGSVRIGDWVEVVFNLTGKKNIQSDGKARWFPSNSGIACTVIERKS